MDTGLADQKKISVEKAVRERYAQGAKMQEAALCCPVEYDKSYLEVIPQEIIDRDYGCGDPSRHVKEGETVLDLGSGTGKICYIISQMVGESGKVIGVDMNSEMLHLARSYQQEVAQKIGYGNVQFRRGKIQDLRLDLDRADLYLRENPIKDADDYIRYEEFLQEQKANQPLIPDASVDLVVSNCVLNLVGDDEKKQLFAETFRVLKPGGRVAISDIVADEEVPEKMKNDSTLWSGCISGALREDDFLQQFADIGFYGIQIEKRDDQPWQTVEGIEFRSLTITAYKGKEGPCKERHQAVIYKGPWKAVIDDDGHTLYRGERMAVCDKTFNIYRKAPYADQIIPVAPYEQIALDTAQAFACNKNARRHPRESKGLEYKVTQLNDGPVCSDDGCC